MIFPQKHLSIEESLFGLGGFLLKLLHTPLNIDELWMKYKKEITYKNIRDYHTFDNLILALNFLYLIGAIELNKEGKIQIETNKIISE